MATVPVRRASRTCRVLGYLPECGDTVVQITEGSKQKGYYVSPFEADGGRGFTWQTWAVDGGNTYRVFVSNDPGKEPHRCECLGFEKWGYRTVCRHGRRFLGSAWTFPFSPIPVHLPRHGHTDVRAAGHAEGICSGIDIRCPTRRNLKLNSLDRWVGWRLTARGWGALLSTHAFPLRSSSGSHSLLLRRRNGKSPTKISISGGATEQYRSYYGKATYFRVDYVTTT